ncbi:MAG: hypothetical protein ACLQUY_12920 [Ktedonobacterales bacterium]
MPGEQSEREEIRPAVPASIHGPVRLNTADTLDDPGPAKEQATGPVKILPPRRPMPSRHPLLVLASGALVLLLLFLLIADVGRSGNAPPTVRTRSKPTATILPTVTPSVFPTPTIRSGFQLFVDTTDGFLLQYPVGWTHRLINPGAQFADDASNATFEMQVLLPSDSAASGLSGDPNDPETWVDFAMQSFANESAGNFQQDVGPLPAANFGGTTWKTARGLITITDQVSIQVQVYATVYLGKPYIIALYAPDGAFHAADMVYFQPMRESFEFLPLAV